MTTKNKPLKKHICIKCGDDCYQTADGKTHHLNDDNKINKDMDKDHIALLENCEEDDEFIEE